MTPTTYIQLAASPGLYPHLQELTGILLAVKWCPMGRLVNTSWVIKQLRSLELSLTVVCCSSNFPSHSQFSLLLRVRYSAWSKGYARWADGSAFITIHWKRRVINSGVINLNVINSSD